MTQVQELEGRITALADVGAFSGAVQVSRGGSPLLCRANGLANRSDNVPNQVDTRFGTASITKMFTAVAIGQLVEGGLLAFETPIADFLPAPHRIPAEVTLHHLLTHTSGIADYCDEDAYEQLWQAVPNSRMHGVADFLPLFIEKAPRFPAGERFEYCNSGYVLLGHVIEEVTGTEYQEFIHTSVFNRAGMSASHFLAMDEVRSKVAVGYIPVESPAEDGDAWRTNHYALPVRGGPDGGAYCTVSDLTRFMDALLSNRLLSESTTRAMLTPHARKNDQSSYGYGIFLRQVDGRAMRGHTGEDPGFSGRLWHLPEEKLTIAVLANFSEASSAVTDCVLETL